jgi:hypothetical protein
MMITFSFEGAEVVARVAGGDSQHFHELDHGSQADARRQAISNIRHTCTMLWKAGVVAGHSTSTFQICCLAGSSEAVQSCTAMSSALSNEFRPSTSLLSIPMSTSTVVVYAYCYLTPADARRLRHGWHISSSGGLPEAHHSIPLSSSELHMSQQKRGNQAKLARTKPLLKHGLIDKFESNNAVFISRLNGRLRHSPLGAAFWSPLTVPRRARCGHSPDTYSTICMVNSTASSKSGVGICFSIASNMYSSAMKS